MQLTINRVCCSECGDVPPDQSSECKPCEKCDSKRVKTLVPVQVQVEEPRLDLSAGAELNRAIDDICNLGGNRYYSKNKQHAEEAARKVLKDIPQNMNQMTAFQICQEIIKDDCRRNHSAR
jgi:hypothetical protein